MAQVRSLAVEPASIETTNWRSTRYKHWVNGFIVDGDYVLVKANKRTWMRTTQYTWNEIVPPFPVPEGKGTPTLINPEDPTYVWYQKPSQWQPCWIVQDAGETRIIDMVTGDVIGRTIRCPSAIVIGGYHSGADEWEHYRTLWEQFYRDTGMPVTLVVADRSKVLANVAGHEYWANVAHGTPYAIALDSIGYLPLEGCVVYSFEVAKQLKGEDPYKFCCVWSCNALTKTGDMTWSKVLTKNMRNCIVIGYKNIEEDIDFWTLRATFKFQESLVAYLREGRYIPDAYEEALADQPGAAGHVDMFEGSSYYPEEPQNLVVGVVPDGAGYVTPRSGLYDPGSIQIEAVPYSGYEFDHWVCSHWEGEEYRIDDRVYRSLIPWGGATRATAYFKEEAPPVTYTLTMAVSPYGSGTTSPPVGTHTYSAGTTVPVTAYPNPGYEFDHWLIKIGTTQQEFPYPSGEVVISNADIQLTAYFKKAEEVAQYSLIVAVSPYGSGYTNPAIGTHYYAEGAWVSLAAYPNQGYEFDYWQSSWPGGAGPPIYMNPIQFRIYADSRLTAYFRKVAAVTFTLTTSVEPPDGGYISPASGTYSEGATVALTAYPYSGYEFDYWKDEAGHTLHTQSIQVTMDSNQYLVAHFKRTEVEVVQYTLTVTVNGSGTVQPSGGVFDEGQVVELTAYPTSGWRTVLWEGTNDNHLNPTTVTMDQDRYVVANFVEEEEAPALLSVIMPVLLIGVLGMTMMKLK